MVKFLKIELIKTLFNQLIILILSSIQLRSSIYTLESFRGFWVRDLLDDDLFVHIAGLLLRKYQVVSVHVAAVKVISICQLAVLDHRYVILSNVVDICVDFVDVLLNGLP